MSLQAVRLLHVGLTVAALGPAAAFYVALGFTADAATQADPALARLLGAERIAVQRLRRGGQALELAAFDPPGAAYPPGSRSDDLWFQHCALPVADMEAAVARLPGHVAISRGGPQRLPERAGGVAAYKFRDPDGHPLELIQFPQPRGAGDGIDHSAIGVADAGRSIAFYRGTLGMKLGSRAVNAGPEQDALDGLDGVAVDVVALLPEHPAPHVELLGYRTPRGRAALALRPADIAATRLALQVRGLAAHPGAALLANGARAALLHDPDGHALLLLEVA